MAQTALIQIKFVEKSAPLVGHRGIMSALRSDMRHGAATSDGTVIEARLNTLERQNAELRARVDVLEQRIAELSRIVALEGDAAADVALRTALAEQTRAGPLQPLSVLPFTAAEIFERAEQQPALQRTLTDALIDDAPRLGGWLRSRRRDAQRRGCSPVLSALSRGVANRGRYCGRARK